MFRNLTRTNSALSQMKNWPSAPPMVRRSSSLGTTSTSLSSDMSEKTPMLSRRSPERSQA